MWQTSLKRVCAPGITTSLKVNRFLECKSSLYITLSLLPNRHMYRIHIHILTSAFPQLAHHGCTSRNCRVALSCVFRVLKQLLLLAFRWPKWIKEHLKNGRKSHRGAKSQAKDQRRSGKTDCQMSGAERNFYYAHSTSRGFMFSMFREVNFNLLHSGYTLLLNRPHSEH